MTLAELLAAAEQGAASVYHKVVDTAAEIQDWETSPLTMPLITIGTGLANSLLARIGVADAPVIEADVATALKILAARDATVASIGPKNAISGMADLAGSVVTGIDPNAAPAVGIAETAVKDAEVLAEKA